MLALAVPEQAEAQTDTTLISNSAQLSTFTSDSVRATAFRTGGHSGGYELSSVDVYVGTLGSGVTPRVEIYENNAGIPGGDPGTLFATLSNPTTVTNNSVNTFTATNKTLRAGRTYWLVTSNSAETDGTGFSVSTRSNDTADAGAAMGWVIGVGRFKNDITDTGAWTRANARIIFTIKGTATDTTAPTVTNAAVGSSGTVAVEFSESLDQSNLPAASAFTGTADGTAFTGTDIVTFTGFQTNLFLTVSPVLRAGQRVVLTYTDPTGGNDANAVQDAAGNDAASFTTGLGGVPGVINAPSAPTSLTATASGTSRIDLSWNAPSYNGGKAITGYKIEISSDGGTTWTDHVFETRSTATTYAHIGLAAGTTRHYRVSARNSSGGTFTSIPSNVDSATTAGVTISETSLTVTEEDTTGGTYTVVLGTQPTAEVTVTVAGHAGTEVTPTPASLTFTTTNWSTAQTVTVTAATDTDTTNDTVTLTHSAASTDSNYSGTTIDSVVVTVEDNDTDGVTISETSLTVTEEDTTGDTYTVVLNTPPTADVTVRVAGHARTVVTPTPASLTFTSTTWSTAQTVTVTARNDADTINDTVTLTHRATSTDSNYSGITIDSVVVTVEDNDTAPSGNVLVSNVGQTTEGSLSLGNNDLAQSFTVTNDTSYTLTSIELNLNSSTSPGSTNTPTVRLYSGSANGTLVSTFTGPARLDTNTTKNYTFTPSSTVTLRPDYLSMSTTYWVVAEGDTRWSQTGSTSEDGTSAMGWGIADEVESRTASSTGSFRATTGFSVQIRVNGTVIPDTTPPALVSATVNAARDKVQLVFSEDLAIPAGGIVAFLDTLSDSFSVTAAGSPLSVARVSVTGIAPRILTLPVSPDIGQGQTVVVTYTDPTAGDDAVALEDAAGNETPSFTTSMPGVPAVINNNAATGAPSITGTAESGHVLTAAAGTIADADGLSGDYTYQWVRVDADGTSNPTPISGATYATYALTAADEGKRVKVQVSFIDDFGNGETRTSAAYPSSGTVAAGSCPAPDLDGRRRVWTGTVTVGELRSGSQRYGHGFDESLSAGGLNTKQFTVGPNGYTIDSLIVDPDGDVRFSLTSSLAATQRAALRLHVCGTGYYDFSGATLNTSVFTYEWDDNLDWSGVSTRTMHLSVRTMENRAATGVPTISGMPAVGHELSASIGGIADADGLPSSFTYQWVQVDADGASNPMNIAGAAIATYTLDAADAGKKVKVQVSFTDSLGGEETLTSDAYPPDRTVYMIAVPGVPQSFTASRGDGRAVLSWAPPLSDGGGAIEKYQYRASDDGGTMWAPDWTDVAGGATADSVTVTSLTNDTAYTFELRAVNSAGGGAEAMTTATPTAIACAVPSFGGRRDFWDGTVTVDPVAIGGSTVLAYGFNASHSEGALDDTTFAIGLNSYTIDLAGVGAGSGTTNEGDLVFSLTSNLTTAEKAALRLHVCDQSYDFSAATLSSSASTYIWDEDDLDWSVYARRTLYLSLPANNVATGEPAITGTARAEQVLTADASPIMDTDGLTDVDITYQWLRVDADGVSNEEDISGEIAETYTLTDDDVDKKVKVKASFTDELSGEEERTSAAYPSSGTVTAAGPNTAPTAANNTVTTGEDMAYAFTAGDFGFLDTDTGDTLASVRIVTVPTPGELALDGTAVLADAVVTKADIDLDKLTFTPVAGATGDPYTTFTFKVNDGTVDSDDAYTMTIDVTAATNTAPVFSSSNVSREIAENTAAGQNVGAAVTATDADAGDTLGYTLGGTDAASFDFVETTGQIRTKTNVSYDFEAKSSYTVTVTASDGNATAVATVTIGITDVAEPPSAPATPMVSAVSGSTTRLSVSWAAPANAGKPAIESYDVQYRAGSSGDWSDGPEDVATTSATVTGLVADTDYEARVRATNAEGDSGWSEPPGSGRTNSSTNNAPVFDSAMPEREIAENTAAGQNVGAAVTATDADAGDTLGYELGGADAASFDIVGTTGQIRTKTNVSYDFEAKSSYTVTVTASDGTATADASVTIGVTDVDEPPSAPATPAVSAVSGSTTRLTVSWAAPGNAGKPAIANYDVQYRLGSSGAWSDGPQDVAGTTATITSLATDTAYQARVRATNAEGDSGWSDPPGSGRTSAPGTSAPGVPRDLGTTPGDGRVTLAWTAPGSDGGAAIEKYRYRVSANAGSSWDPDWTDVPDGADAGDSAADETTFTVSGLSNGTEYVFELRAVNSVGEGPAASAADTPVRAPLPPGSGFLVGNFGQTADRVASIFVTQDIVGVFTTGARGAELHNIEFRFFTRLPNIAVLPIPSVTLYRASVTDSRATRGARVAALTAVAGTPRSTDTAQTVAFAAPSGTRLEAGATYLVVLEHTFPVSVESTTFPAEDAGGAPGWAIDGIGAGNNSPYSYRTTASLLMRVNGTVAGATVTTAPEAPASLGARAGNAEVTLRWAPPRSDGGAGIEKYQVRYSAGSRVDPETGWTDVPDGSDSGTSVADERSVSVTGLDNGRQYAFELRAVNRVRAGAGATATATPAAPPRSGFLVSNFGQPVDGAAQIYVTKDIVGAFTAGALGATLDSIELRLFTRRPNIAVLPIPSVTLYRGSVTDSRATRGARVAALTAVAGSRQPANTAQTVAFAAPSGTRLDAGATYLVVLEHTSYVRVESTNASAQDAGGASGWTIDGVGAGNSSPYSYGTSDSLLMSVNGTTARAQRAVREEAVRKKAAKDEQQEEEQVQEQVQEPATSPDPDRGISLSTSSSSAIEGQAATISVRRAGPTDRTTSVAVQVLDSALTGAWPIDVELRSGVATATATVPIPFDGARPASRTVTVSLASVEEPYSVGSPSTLTFNVTDRDAALSVDDASVSEGPGATLAFAVTLDRTRDREVRVKYATSDGTATQGDDYTGVSGTLRFAPGETTKTVSVTVLDDAHDEGSETLTLTLSSSRRAVIDDDTAVGTIVNSDPLPNAWLSRFGRAASDHVVQSIGRRLEGGARESHLTVMGWRMDRLFESSYPERDGREPRADAPGWQANGSVRAPDGRIGAAGAMTGATRGVGAMSGPGAARPAFDGAMTQGFPPMQGGTLQSPARPMGGLPANAGGNPGAPDALRGAPGVVPVAVHAPGAVHAPAARGRGGPWANMLQGLLMKVGAGGDVRAPGLRDMVMGSSFYYGYSPDAGLLRSMNRLTAWGESASTRFSGAEGKLSLDGEVNTAILGADGEWGRWLAGLALSYSEGEGGYRQVSAKGGAVSSTLTGVNPYARYRLDERTSLWATLGYGSGRLTLTPDGAESSLETDMTNAMAAFGGRGVLSMRAGKTGQFELALRSDAMLTDTASIAVAGLSAGEGATSRIRLILEGSGSLPAFGGVLAPKVEAGLRYDGGDAETGAGLEVGGGLAYDKDRLTVQVDGRVLLTHRDRDYEEWGYSLSFVYQPGEDGRGLRYQAGSQWGATQSGVQSLWSLQNAGGLASGARTADGQRYTAELGYGFGERRLWYPYVATESGGASSQALRFGLKLNAASDLEAGLEIGRRPHMSGQIENDIRLQWRARW